MSALARLLLNAPEKPVHFGAGDLSLYRDIATMDPHPGFLNGILSLVLNGASPQWQYESENQTSVAYFHRARASQLLDLLDVRFPHAKDAPSLHASLIGAYEQYGDDDGVIRAGRKFLAVYPKSFEHYSVALTMASSFARQRRVAEEQAIYDSLLKELAGNDSLKSQYEQVFTATSRVWWNSSARMTRWLCTGTKSTAVRKIRRFTKARGIPGAARPGRAGRASVQRGRRQVPDSGWQEKLARWYLRLRRRQDFAELTRQVVQIFSGTGLEKYFREIVAPGRWTRHSLAR